MLGLPGFGQQLPVDRCPSCPTRLPARRIGPLPAQARFLTKAWRQRRRYRSAARAGVSQPSGDARSSSNAATARRTEVSKCPRWFAACTLLVMAGIFPSLLQNRVRIVLIIDA